MDLTPLKALPGAVQRNFEVLTRSIVSRRYGALGALRERRQQPGVEFYLKVDHAGTLGDPGRVWGWSCKWFELNGANELTASQRDQIEDSLDKAIRHVDGLTDFVLCLPRRPAKKDLDWIYALADPRGLTVRLWAGEDFEEQLGGCDELRSTFFGELVFTANSLAKAHERSVAPVQARWVPPVHTANSVEHLLEQALLRPQAFDPLSEHADALAARVAELRTGLDNITDSDARTRAVAVTDDLDGFVAQVRAIVDAARQLSPFEAIERIAEQQPPVTTPRQLHELVLDLRRRRLPAALAVTGMPGQVREIMHWLAEIQTAATAPLVAVVAAAGEGKTHLMAEVTAPMTRPSAGVFILGWRLRTGGSLDELAQRIPGLTVQRFEDLLEAANSAGARAGVRIPIAIDGLNEAERPSEWRAMLDELVPALGAYPHVLVVVTLRETLAERAVPEQALTVNLEWQQDEVDELVEAYFAHYLIESAGAWLPMWLFRHPLLLRMYCEAANPAREHPVGVEALPRSLIGVFERYRDAVCARLADDPARVHVPADQIKRRLAQVALDLWTRGVRRVASDEAMAVLDAGQSNWEESLFRRLVEEGVLLREEASGSDDTETAVTFDLFAGYLIADALLTRIAYHDVANRLADPDLWRSLLGDDSHPLGQDVAVALVALLPRRFAGQHLWRHAPEAHRSWALAQELGAESKYLDDATVDALAALLADPARKPAPSRPYPRLHAFDRLWETAGAPEHRLHASFLDRVLRQMSLPQRDLSWTEWVRHRADELLLPDLNRLNERWSANLHRSDADDLQAIAVAWLTSSTHNGLRDLATKALQRYGRPDPGRLFDVAARFLDVDDPYVVERVVGAALGAGTAHQMPDPAGRFENALAQWLTQLRDCYLTGGSTPTSHELLRSYVRATFELAGTLHPPAVPAGIDAFTLSFAEVPPVPTLAEDDERATEAERTFGMDFENYVIGSSIQGRENYDFDHEGFRRARAEVLARVWELGWRVNSFGDLDRIIGGDRDRFGRDGARIERYGKKYGWIAYYELIGRQIDRREERDRWVGADRNVSPDCDPTFPDEPPVLSIALPQWAPVEAVDERQWVASGTIEIPQQLWAPDELHGVSDWILAEGFLEQRVSGRRVFGFFRTLLLDRSDLDEALGMIDQQEYLGNDFFPRLVSVRDVFAGEVPWSPRYRSPDDEEGFPRGLRRNWQDDGVGVRQLAVDLEPVERNGPTALSRAYAVPSYEFAEQFSLRQLPGTLDLVGLDGVRASATFSVAAPWTGHALFVRRDLVMQYTGGRVAVQVAWGERTPAVDWQSTPEWVTTVYQAHKHVWCERRVIDPT